MVKIVQKLLPASRYSIKCPYAMTPKYVVMHNTANDAPAANEIAYMINRPEEVSFHFAVDDKEAVQGIPETRNAWHSGDGHGPGNMTGIAIEICYSASGGAKFDAAEKNAAQLAASLLKKYGWGIDHLKKHQDFDGKYCPHRTLDRGWSRFVKMVEAEMGGATPEPTPTPAPEEKHLYRVRTSWKDVKSQVGAFEQLDNAKKCADTHPGYTVFDETGKAVYTSKAFTPYTVRRTCTAPLNIRREPTTASPVTGQISDRKLYTIVDEAKGPGSDKGWGKLKSGAGWIALDWVEKSK